MKYELFIGLRYLQARRQETFISLITVISVLGVMIGVMTLNVVMAVMGRRGDAEQATRHRPNQQGRAVDQPAEPRPQPQPHGNHLTRLGTAPGRVVTRAGGMQAVPGRGVEFRCRLRRG